MNLSSRLLVVLAIGSLTSFGCKKEQAQEPLLIEAPEQAAPEGPQPEPTEGGTGTSPQAESEAASNVAPCEVLTAEEVQAFAGEALSPKENEIPGARLCQWMPPRGNPAQISSTTSMIVTIAQKTTPFEDVVTSTTMFYEPEPEKVSDLGDEAVFLGEKQENFQVALYLVAKGRNVVLVQLNSANNDADAKDSMLKATRLVLSRL